MPARSSAVTKDEELGKRDDDYDSRAPGQRSSITLRAPWRRWRRRLIIAGAIIAIYYLLWDVPSRTVADLVSSAKKHDAKAVGFSSYQAPTGVPPRDESAKEEQEQKHYYNGRARFYNLGKSLSGIAFSPHSRNVLFAASLGSMASLVPMACEMASVDKSHVHVALFGRSSLSLEEVLAINAVDLAACKVYWHDARPDFAQYSSDTRAVSAVKAAMKHINEYIHPKAVIIDDSAIEDPLFSRTMRKACGDFGIPLIEIPSGKYEDFLWITRLDAESLSRWTLPNVAIVIRSLPGSAGSLIRLLKSLGKAHYHGLKVPHLTIELPPRVDGSLQKFLADFKWPPARTASTAQSSLLSIHHRIPTARLNSETSSLRFAELFFPSQPEHDNVLLLSPHVELSPTFLHFLHFQMLGYRYSMWFGGLAGISLDVPEHSLNGSGNLDIPTLANGSFSRHGYEERDNSDDASSFLYHAPSSTATLYFGETWALFHDFLSKRLEVIDSGKDSDSRKFVSESEPAWLEYLLELMRVRGWSVLHPSTGFVTVHHEQTQVQEEFGQTLRSGQTSQLDEMDSSQSFLGKPADSADPVEHDTDYKQVPLHQLLPFGGVPPPLWSIPNVNYDGLPATEMHFGNTKETDLVEFRKAHGGCQGSNATRRRIQNAMNTDDLFCLPGLTMDFADEALPDPGEG